VNDTDREEFIDNDEGLYRWWKGTRLPKRRFIRENRRKIDEVINNVQSGKKPSHYLEYEK
jgi:hypothetical protein